MFRKILDPLDGSVLAERALLSVQSLASCLGSTVHLLCVSESSSEWGYLIDSYLKGVTARLAAQDIKAQATVLFGKPAEELLDYAERHKIGLIAMATHGRSGISRWTVGSVTDKIVHSADVPILVSPAQLSQSLSPPVASFRRFLLPLDGSKLAESAVPILAELAHKLRARVLLLRVVEQDSLKPEAQNYLDSVSKKFDKKEVKTTTAVHSGVAWRQILESARSNKIDLIALCTHGRGGVSRWVLGSVADKILHTAECAVLLTRATAKAPSGTTIPALMAKQCYNCGRKTYLGVFFPEDKCLRCGFHLRACGNCVHYNGIGCLLQRPEVHDPYPGMHCPLFLFRQTPVRVK